MRGIKGIAEILERLAVVTLFAAIEPNGDQCQHGKALLRKGNCSAKERDLINKTAQQLCVDMPKEDQLCRPLPKVLSAEEVENQYGKDTCVIEVNEGQRPCDTGDDYTRHADSQLLPKAPL